MEPRQPNVLDKYLPDGCSEGLLVFLKQYNAQLKVSRPRRTKLGDYRPPHDGMSHRITVNGNLNQYAFLVTLVHEIAHMTNWVKNGRKVKPHGKEWKDEFKTLMQPYMSAEVFPKDVEVALMQYLANPGASSCSDPALLKTLNRYNSGSGPLYLDDLPDNALFALDNGRIFRKGKKQRTRYKCLEMKSRREYLVSGIAEVRPVEK